VDVVSGAPYCLDPDTPLYLDGAGAGHCYSDRHAYGACGGLPYDAACVFDANDPDIVSHTSCATIAGDTGAYAYDLSGTWYCVAPGLDDAACTALGLGGFMIGEGILSNEYGAANVALAPYAGCSYDASSLHTTSLTTCDIDDVGAVSPTLGSAGRTYGFYGTSRQWCMRPAADISRAACAQLVADEAAGTLAANPDTYVHCAITCSDLQGYGGEAVVNAELDIAL
jgi:hypothetical protein